MVAKAGLNERIIFLGFRREINKLMSRATALIVPSAFEGFGFTTVEAMFNGCLIIGNNSGGTKEILEQEKLGILYSGQNEMVDAMRKVTSNNFEYFIPIICKAQKVASRLYSCEKNAEEICNIYHKILVKIN